MNQTEKSKNPKGVGLGPCPEPMFWGKTPVCRCGPCRVCGNPKHSAVHMHKAGDKPGDLPYDHEFVPMNRKKP